MWMWTSEAQTHEVWQWILARSEVETSSGMPLQARTVEMERGTVLKAGL